MRHKVACSLRNRWRSGEANLKITAFVCVAALAILDRLDVVDVDTLGWWLAERQLPSGGLNGRPEKLEDVSNLVLIYFLWSLYFRSIIPVTPLFLQHVVGMDRMVDLVPYARIHPTDPILVIFGNRRRELSNSCALGLLQFLGAICPLNTEESPLD